MDVAQHLGEPRKLLLLCSLSGRIDCLMVIVVSALAITTSDIRAQELRRAEEDAAGKSHC